VRVSSTDVPYAVAFNHHYDRHDAGGVERGVTVAGSVTDAGGVDTGTGNPNRIRGAAQSNRNTSTTDRRGVMVVSPR
jgi:hypothetical protein